VTSVAAAPHVSVVIPTRNRQAAVHRLIGRLAHDRGQAPGVAIEVIVVDDGSTDDTPGSLSETSWPFPVRVLRQRNAGAAVARNAGARAASGNLLLFLDDDVEPEPGLVAAHVRAHDDAPDLVGLGDLPPRVPHHTLLGVMLRTWWGEMQAAIGRPGHRFSYRDLLSGHFSMRRTALGRLGGFDERFRCREDYELGYRVVRAGLRMRFIPQAVAWHHDSSDIGKAIARKIDEGTADVQLITLHPPLAASLPVGRGPAHRGLQGRMMRLAWKDARLGVPCARALRALLPVLERLRLRQRWRGALNGLLSYWYWRGVAQTVGTPAALDAMLASAARVASAPPMLLDLADGLDAAAARIDMARPQALRLVLGQETIGDVPDLPGAEPLGGEHLRPLLATTLRREYLRVLAATGAVPPPLLPAAAALAAPVAAAGRRGAAA
jgi:GT2 family glycosyltransferase